MIILNGISPEPEDIEKRIKAKHQSSVAKEFIQSVMVRKSFLAPITTGKERHPAANDFLSK